MVPNPRVTMARRGPSRFRALVDADNRLETALVPIEYGPDERYLACVSHDQVRVFRPDGTEVTVIKTDFDYLDLRRRQELDDAETLQTSGGAWTAVGSANATVLGAGPDCPLGWPVNASHPSRDKYSQLAVAAGLLNDGEYRQQFTSYLWDRKWAVLIHVSLNVPGAGTLVLPEKVGLMIEDPTDLTKHLVEWDVSGGASVTPPVATNTFGFRTFTEPLDVAGEYLLGFHFDPNRSTGTPASSTIGVEFRIIDGTSGSDPSGVYGWGFLCVPDPPEEKLPRFALPPERLRRVSAGASTFFANPLVPTRLTATTSDAITDAYPDRAYVGSAALFPTASAGYVFHKLSAGSTPPRTLTVKVKDTLGVGGTKTLTSTTLLSGSTRQDAIDTASDLNTDPANTDGTTDILEATALESTVRMVTKDNSPTSKWEIQEILWGDTVADESAFGFTDRVEALADLPPVGPCQHGHVVKLIEAGADPDDFLAPQVILRFESDLGVGTHGAGRWVEGTDYGVRTELDGATLPHVLVRKFDDSVGTVTTKALEPYFEWEEHDWDDRLVGGDLANPAPSFMTPAADEGTRDRFVDAIGFHQNRLAVGSDLDVAFSEVSNYGNFWRTTLQALPDSDRIDVAVSLADAAPVIDIFGTQSRLFLRTGRGAQVVTASGPLGPRTVGFESVYSGSSRPVARSAPAAGGVFIPGDGEDNGEVAFIFPAGDDGLSFQELDVTEDAPRLLKAEVHTMEWVSPLMSLLVHSRDDAPHVFGMRFSPAERQVAWYPLDFGGDDVQSLAALGGELFVLVSRESGSEIESVPLDEFQRDPGQDWRVYLDRRLTDRDLDTAMSYGAPNTTITLPYTITPGATVIVAERSGAAFGAKKTVVSATGSTVTVRGDVTGDELFIGEAYTSRVKPLRPVLRDQSVDPPELRPQTLDQESGGVVDVVSCNEPVAVTSEDYLVDLSIETSEQKPLNVGGIEWVMEVEDTAGR
jgi:hypothetical protein